MPTTLEDFDDSVLGDPITYERCEWFPGSESPLSLPVYAWPSGSAFLLDSSVIQTVLAPGTSALPAEGTSTSAPSIASGGEQIIRDRIAGLSVPILVVRRTTVCRWKPGIWFTAPESARLLDCSPTFWVDQLGNKEQAMAAAINLKRDADVML